MAYLANMHGNSEQRCEDKRRATTSLNAVKGFKVETCCCASATVRRLKNPTQRGPEHRVRTKYGFAARLPWMNRNYLEQLQCRPLSTLRAICGFQLGVPQKDADLPNAAGLR